MLKELFLRLRYLAWRESAFAILFEFLEAGFFLLFQIAVVFLVLCLNPVLVRSGLHEALLASGLVADELLLGELDHVSLPLAAEVDFLVLIKAIS